MRKIEIEVFTIAELSDDAKERARDWWRSCDSDDFQFAAENIRDAWKERGVKILKLDERECSIDFSDYVVDVAEKIAGDEYLAKEIPEAAAFVAATKNHASSDWCDISDAEQEAYEEFLRATADYIRRQWQAEIDWIDSDEYVDGAIASNEYEFTREGKFHA